MKRKAYGISITACILLIAALLSVPVFSEGNTAAYLLQTKVTEDSVLLYVRGGSEKAARAFLGSEPVSDVTVSGADGTTPTVTWLLVDNSLSINSYDRSRTKELLTDITAGRARNERFNLCTISDHLHPVLLDSDDYAALKQEIEGISYANQETYLTDVLAELLDLEKQRGATEFVRVLVVSDGVDNNPGGVTREAVQKELLSAGIPVYSVGCQGVSQELKEMYSLSRETNARSWEFRGLSTWEVAAALSGEELPLCASIRVPEALRDGAVKGVQLTFEDGTSVQTQATMPFSEIRTTLPPKPTPTPAPTPRAATPPPRPTIAPVPEPTAADWMRAHWLFIVGIALLLVILIPVLTLLPRRKKQKQSAAPVKTGSSPAPDAPLPAERAQPPFVPSAGELADEAGTVYMAGPAHAGSENSSAPLITLSLQDERDPTRYFEASLSGAGMGAESGTVMLSAENACPTHGEVRVGRAPGNDIVIDYDKSISGSHCKIAATGDHVLVYDLGSTNGTLVDGTPVIRGGSAAAGNGSRLQLGRTVFRLGLRVRLRAGAAEEWN